MVSKQEDFMYIDDCIDGTLKVFKGEYSEVFNVGSDERVSINQMIQIIEDIAEYKVKNYLLDKPKGLEVDQVMIIHLLKIN